MDSPSLKRPSSSLGNHSAKKKCITPSITNYFSPKPRNVSPKPNVVETVRIKDDIVIDSGTELKPTTIVTPLKALKVESPDVLTPPRTQPLQNTSQVSRSQLPSTPKTPQTSTKTLRTSMATPSDLNKTYDCQGSSAAASCDENFAHLSYVFLQPDRRRDIDGHRPDHPDYDPKTLSVPDHFLDSQTPALRQWWIIKQKNMDAILLFKMGKFYELFNEDAVIAVNELDIMFMKADEGKPAHAGFPESSFGKYSSILVNKGYRVLRIEQTETPDMMAERIQRTNKKGKFDRVVAREVCQVTTKGTQMLSVNDSVFHTAQSQYLLAICEATSEFNGNSRRNTIYGICFTDVTTSKIYYGQFEDDNNLSNLNILLAHHAPTEIIYERNNLSQNAYQALFKTGARLSSLKSNKEFWPIGKALSHLKTNHIYADESGRCKWPQDLIKMFEGEEGCEDILNLEPKNEFRLALNSFSALVYYLNSQLIDKQVLKCTVFEHYISPLDRDRSVHRNKMMDRPPMVLDHIAIRNLEIFTNSSGGANSTLFHSINQCKTHFGQRLLANWLCSPLCDVKQIENRLDAVENLMSNTSGSLLNEIVHMLGQLPDLERILSKIKNQCFKSETDSRAIMFDGDLVSKAKISSFLNLLNNFNRLHKFIGSISKSAKNNSSSVLKRLLSFTTDGGLYPDCTETLKYFEKAFDHREAQQTGKIIPSPGVDKDYDECAEEIRSIKEDLSKYLEEQKEKLRCHQLEYFGTLKNRYQIQVPESHLRKVPDNYRLETARKGFKRFYTAFIDEKFAKLTCCEEKMKRILDGIMSKIFEQFISKVGLWSAAIECVAILDVLQSIAFFARTLKANNINVCRPKFIQDDLSPKIDYIDGRHPIMVKSNPYYTPNDLLLDDRLILLSGANMGGKSTIMRQTALIVVLAQIGCFVPAESLELTPVDRIFSRLGASDRLFDGESTFYTELVETSAMLRCATRDSLLLLDELGRGTSTFDGTAIAHSVIKEISSNIKCRCLFSTHYHTLSKEFENNARIRLAHMACKVEKEANIDDEEVDMDPLKENITFLYKITSGAASKSYGFNVAKLAGIPDGIIRAAFRKSCQVGVQALHAVAKSV